MLIRASRYHRHSRSSPSRFSTRVFLVIFGCLQNILAGGIIYGWTGISGSILTTSREKGGAGLSPSLTIHIFSLATSVGCFSQVPLGIINDKNGPRFCSVLSNLIVSLGCFVFVSSESWKRIASGLRGEDDNDGEDNENIFYTAGAILIAFGQPGVQLPLVHLGNLFPTRENSVVSLITSTLSISFVVFPIIGSIWETYHIDFRMQFQILGGIIWSLAILSLYLWPDFPFEKQILIGNEVADEDKASQYTSDYCFDSITRNTTNQQHGYKNIDDLGSSNTFECSQVKENGTLRDQLLSTKMLRLTIYFVTAWYWGDMYVATLPIELKDQRYFNQETNNHLVQIFSYMSSLGLFVSPLVGYSLDTWGSSITCAGTFTLGIIQMILLLSVPLCTHAMQKSLLVANFLLNNLFRTFLYPCFYASVIEHFGLTNVGILSGTIVFIFGISFLILVPMGEFALGTCHLYNSNGHDESDESCSEGRWSSLHVIQILSLGILVIDILVQDKGTRHWDS